MEMPVGARFHFRALTLTAILTLAACGGDDGAPGPAGPTGATGPAGPPGDTVVVHEDDPESLSLTIDSVTVEDGVPVVEFRAFDEGDNPFAGLEGDNVRFNIAKLIPGSDGDPSAWQNYINTVEEAGSAGPGTEDTIQASREDDGTLTNNGDGSYVYRFATNISSVTSPLAVDYDASLVHRVGMELSGVPDANAVYTFIPATGVTSGFDDRTIVKTETCNDCHNELALHGGHRLETQYCVTCHNPGTVDANSGNTVDFKVMVHKIHMGADLPSGDYTIYGFRDTPHDFTEVHYPQSQENCTTCHDPDDADTPQASNFADVPSIEACGSCHDDVDFAQGVAGGHPGGVVTQNSECTVCHAPDRVAGSVQESHERPELIWAVRFEYNIIDITDTAPGETPTITYSITDPTDGDAPYDLAADPEFTSAEASVSIDIAWETADYTNDGGAGRAPASVSQVDALSGTANGDGTYTVTAGFAIPADAVGSGAVAMEGHPGGDFNGDSVYDDSVPVKSVVSYFPITDAEAVPRRQVVDTGKCQDCHNVADGLSLHGGNRNDEVEVCVLCHNPNNTDIAMRPSDPDATDDEVNTAAADGREERSIDFKFLIHAIHASDIRQDPLVVYGFFNSVHDFSDRHFPGFVNDCETCHVDDSYILPLDEDVLATTVDTQSTVLTSNSFGNPTYSDPTAAGDPDDDGNITRTAAVCSSCHDGTEAQAHMELNGASFDTTQAFVDSGLYVESCSVCHGPGRIADVEAVHGGD